MNSKLAILWANRWEASEHQDSDDYRYLVRTVFPLISSCAHRGLRQTAVPGFINDVQFDMLRALGYVVRHEQGLCMTSIEWAYQPVIDGGKSAFISPQEYNRRIDESRAKVAALEAPAITP